MATQQERVAALHAEANADYASPEAQEARAAITKDAKEQAEEQAERARREGTRR